MPIETFAIFSEKANPLILLGCPLHFCFANVTLCSLDNKFLNFSSIFIIGNMTSLSFGCWKIYLDHGSFIICNMSILSIAEHGSFLSYVAWHFY